MRNGWNFLALRTVWVFYLCHIVNLGFTGWVWIQKFILWQLFCIYTLPVNWQYDTCSGMCKHIPWGYFQLSTCVEVATPSVTKDLGFHVLIRKMRVSSRFNKRKIDIILSERFFSIPTQECTEILSVHHHLDLFISRKILIYTILNEEKGIWKRQMNWSTSYEI